uniref:Collagen triple helix repeat protein n=1 Tax=Steinernema glaseri TaxID=37863 RepID=A0A1I8AJZ6_9BILA
MLATLILLSFTAGSPLRRSKESSTGMVTTPSGDTSTTAIYCAPFCDDVDFSALSRTRDMWVEVFAIHDTVTGQNIGKSTVNRVRRAWMFGKWVQEGETPDGGIGGGYDSGASSGGYGSSAQTGYESPSSAPPAYGSPNPSSAPGPIYSQTESAAVVSADVQACCTCQQGPPGEAGPPGDDGEDGADGNPGEDGKDGRDGQILPASGPQSEPCIICP